MFAFSNGWVWEMPSSLRQGSLQKDTFSRWLPGRGPQTQLSLHELNPWLWSIYTELMVPSHHKKAAGRMLDLSPAQNKGVIESTPKMSSLAANYTKKQVNHLLTTSYPGGCQFQLYITYHPHHP